MLIEGGYLDSMKRILEKAAQTPDPASGRDGRADSGVQKPSRASRVGRSLKRLTTLLLGPRRG